MPRKATLLKSLSRGRIRASFNKWNLFNLYKKGQVDFKGKTLYQQKWTAKQETRAYHGEYLTESRWLASFNPKLDSVAQLDASLKKGGQDELDPTPYLMQTYASLEKRLDFAVFRSMFASSVRQARQFILHGNTFVNGIKIKHPGYILKPGDVFHVKPEKVLQALGAKKPSLENSLKIDKIQVEKWNHYVTKLQENPREEWEKKMEFYSGLENHDPKKTIFLELVEKYNQDLETRVIKERKTANEETILNKILTCYIKATPEKKEILKSEDFMPYFFDNKDLSIMAVKIYQQILGSAKILDTLKKNEEESNVAKILFKSEEEIDKKNIREIKTLCQELKPTYFDALENYFKINKASSKTGLPYDPVWASSLNKLEPIVPADLVEDEKKAISLIQLPWQSGPYGRADPKKPYFTPWTPRPFLAPFAVLPHHIEISFKTCHAIYLRDPVARPGHSEVISPYALPVHERAYMYYNRKGK
ncbi:related to 37S ribosomal protein NAM9, mitochondrial [Saccharomycodes ludwigii]|uniref:Small ribosomal subunit protein uS4m n=1 Tax=Saccharomycodes ludwigii TaxID=36035 RepID=A0A376B7J9_9ASCO|nr:hypothetical protein SCDLUD_002861 [Saccharomycodes ludwigii]KAH3901369.1 hypothetical protein SCDLUD_002861 [Saccharomycodes ludwigii]SSD60676.1 related to 37S ribosomal protein NAM9, mitochondrial [Saccharomycodes ludwigii]